MVPGQRGGVLMRSDIRREAVLIGAAVLVFAFVLCYAVVAVSESHRRDTHRFLLWPLDTNPSIIQRSPRFGGPRDTPTRNYTADPTIPTGWRFVDGQPCTFDGDPR